MDLLFRLEGVECSALEKEMSPFFGPIYIRNKNPAVSGFIRTFVVFDYNRGFGLAIDFSIFLNICFRLFNA